MRCSHVHKRSSAFIDGDMSAEEMAAIRGHLRSCGECAALVEDERALVSAAGELESPEPPAALWQSIQERIADEEIAESEKAPWRLWLGFNWKPLAGAGVACAAGLVLWWSSRSDELHPASSARSDREVTVAVLAPQSFQSERTSAIDEAERDYRDTVLELREMVEGEMGAWAEVDRERYRELVRSFDDERARLGALGSSRGAVRSRDPLWASYRKEINLLEGALFGQVESLALAAPEVSP
jgi:hypothetical protein